VVDDEPQLRRVMLATLTDLGYVVITATSGEEALEKFRHEPPDLVLLDLNMPGMGGLETCRALRAGSMCRSSYFRFATPSAIKWKRSTPEPTIMSPSLSAFKSCWRAYGRHAPCPRRAASMDLDRSHRGS